VGKSEARKSPFSLLDMQGEVFPLFTHYIPSHQIFP